LGAGTHTLTLSVSDRAGNTSERSVSVQLIAPTPLPGASPLPVQQPTANPATQVSASSTSSLPAATPEPAGSEPGQPAVGSSSAAPSRTPVVSIFSSAKPTPVPDAGVSTDPNLAGNTDQPPIAWGAVAMAAMGGLTAYVLDEQRKRKQAEAQQKAEIEMRAAQFNAEQEQRRAEAMAMMVLEAVETPKVNTKPQDSAGTLQKTKLSDKHEELGLVYSRPLA